MNKRKNDYYNEHRKLLTPILEQIKNMTEQEGKEYVKTLRPLQQKIFNDYFELYEDYKYSFNEIYARQAGKRAVERYINEKENYRMDGQTRQSLSSVVGRPQERNLGTGDRNSSQRGSQENQRIFKEETVCRLGGMK